MKVQIIKVPNKYKFGGVLSTQGGDFSNGLTFINNGGSHEENPYGGIPLGLAPDMQENFVEEGEVIWKDYVFSDRIKVPKELSEKYKLNDMSFAKAVKKLQKGAEERPNDKIEQDSLNTILSELAQEQEAIRQRRAEKKVMNGLQELADMYAEGGGIHIAKNKRGTFTAAATKHGMGVQEFARKVLANKEDYSPAMVKKANFARNASKWSHGLGGYLFAMGGPVEGDDILTYDFTPDESGFIPSNEYLEQLKANEGFDKKVVQRTYKNKKTGKDILDRKTIGHGVTDDDVIKFFEKENREITTEEADYYMKRHLGRDFDQLKKVNGWGNLNSNQKEAVLDYAYNRGVGNAIEAIKLYNGNIEEHYKNKPDSINVSNRRKYQFDLWNKVSNDIPINPTEQPKTTTSRPKSLLSRPLKSSKVGRYAFGGTLGHYFVGDGTEDNYLKYQYPAQYTDYLWAPEYQAPNVARLPQKNALEAFQKSGVVTEPSIIANPNNRNNATVVALTDEELGVPTTQTTTNTQTSSGLNPAYLRYAPVLGSAISSIASALDTPNRSYARNLRNSARAFSNMMQPISSRPIANYLKYNPLDRMFYTNQLMSSAAANRSAIRENASANRQAAINNLLAADYNTNVGLGNLFRQAEEYNQAQRERVAGFNRETDRYNSAIALDAAKQNAATRQAKASMLWDAAQKANMLDMQEDQLLQASRNQALTNLFNNFGGVGKEEYIFQMMRDNPDLAYYLTGLGNMRYKKPE